MLSVAVTEARAAELDWEQVYADEHDRLFGLAMVISRSPEDAADAVQSAFEKAFRARHRIQADLPYAAFLARITVNEAISVARRRRIIRWLALSGDMPAEGSAETSDVILVRMAVKRLSPKHRAVVGLFYLCGYPLEEVSAILGIPSGTVASRLHHARHVLRQLMAVR